MIGYRLKSDELTALQKRAASIGASEELALVGGRAAANLTKDHLFARDARGNKLGGKRTHFYSDAAKSVSNPHATVDTVAFTITKLGLAQRWLGGPIKPGSGTSSFSGGPTKYLAIPARTEAYGVPPSAFVDLRFVPRRGGGGMLVQALQYRVGFGKKRSVDGVTVASRNLGKVGGLVFYWLVTGVTQAPDPTVMPTEEELLTAVVDAESQYLSRRLQS